MVEELDVGEVQPGDVVRVQDRDGNLITSEVRHDGNRWLVRAFSTDIVFARDRPSRLGKGMASGVRLLAHMSQLV